MPKISTPKMPSVNGKAGGGIPGSSSKSRINQAAGQKVSTAKPGKGGAYAAPDSVSVASGSNLVMPVDHPSAKTTRTTKGGTL